MRFSTDKVKKMSVFSNESDFSRLVERQLSRRSFLATGASLGIAAFLGLRPTQLEASEIKRDLPLLGFKAISASSEDTIRVPEGYHWKPLVSWGEPIFGDTPDFDPSGMSKAIDQAHQFGDNNDGMSLFPLTDERAILAINNEYSNNEYLYPDDIGVLSSDDVLKSQYAHGVSIVEIQRDRDGFWQLNKSSKYNRRIHAQTKMELTGPVAGHPLVQTKIDPTGRQVLGTFNNCANGQTPWGTYLTCEENFNGYFAASEEYDASDEQKRYGLKGKGRGYDWHQHDERFDLSKHPNEANRFGWVVEIDPMDPHSTPKKRTALGRFKHENAALLIDETGHVVVYLGDDERGEHLYKFVSKNIYQPANEIENRDLLSDGTLYVARFSGDGTNGAKGKGEWIPLKHGQNGLTAENGFPDQASILTFARLAATQVGATTMDRPEWVAIHPSGKQVYCTLTNNKHRGKKKDQPLSGPNPRAENHYGQIVRWHPIGSHVDGGFEWDLFLLAGNPAVHKDIYGGSQNINQLNMFNSPDGIGFDKQGRLWIQTDGNYSNSGDFEGMGNNQMLCGDPLTGEVRRFLTGPVACEITGLSFSPDYKTMFVGIQHPGEKKKVSHFPEGGDSKPRSTVIMIRREDGGVVGGW